MNNRSWVGNANQQKPRNAKKVIRRLWRYLYKYKWLVVLAFILAVSGNILALVGPKLSGNAIDAIGTKVGAVDFNKVYFYAGLMILFYIISAAFAYILQRVMISLSQKTIYQMRKDVFNKIESLPVSFFDKHQIGDIISRISYDIDTVNASLSNDLIQICTSVITVGGSLFMMLIISPLLLTVFILTVPIAIFSTRYMTKKVRPLFRKRSEMLGELNGFVEEVISGQKTTKAYNREQIMIDRFDKKNTASVDAYYMADYYSGKVGPNIGFVNNLSLAMISIFGAILYILTGFSLGKLSSFVLYSRKFSGPINEVANIISELQSACAAAERIFTLLDESPEKEDDKDAEILSDVRGQVDINNIKFGYNPEKIIIHDFSLDVEPGKLIAIVGHTGEGKTTIINLLMRFYDMQSGSIEIDGKEITKVTRKSLRKAFAMVLQDTWLFHGTIFENIAYGKVDATEEDVINVAKAARIHSYISRLAKGYNTVLSDNGINISQGQKQLLTIARAMLLDANMLILDEATSNVDTRTEVQIQAAMRELMKDKTCFVIAHRLSTIRNADKILVMADGDVVESGNHDELIAKNGTYAELYNSQFK